MSPKSRQLCRAFYSFPKKLLNKFGRKKALLCTMMRLLLMMFILGQKVSQLFSDWKRLSHIELGGMSSDGYISLDFDEKRYLWHFFENCYKIKKEFLDEYSESDFCRKSLIMTRVRFWMLKLCINGKFLSRDLDLDK